MHSENLKAIADNLSCLMSEARDQGETSVSLSMPYLSNLLFVLDRIADDARQMEQAMLSALILSQDTDANSAAAQDNVVPFFARRTVRSPDHRDPASRPDGAA